eukprot:scaffold2854_cov116-Isochrysis_galbana.AAC.5
MWAAGHQGTHWTRPWTPSARAHPARRLRCRRAQDSAAPAARGVRAPCPEAWRQTPVRCHPGGRVPAQHMALLRVAVQHVSVYRVGMRPVAVAAAAIASRVRNQLARD